MALAKDPPPPIRRIWASITTSPTSWEKAVAAVLKAQLWSRKRAEYSATITEGEMGRCTVHCTINRLDEKLFSLDLGMPDRLTAEQVKKQFILKGNEIYQLLINKLTEEEPTFSEKK